MNRDLRRSMQRKAHDQKQMNYEASKIVMHNKTKQAMDNGILMGFYCAIQMIGDICDEVTGIGDKRKQELIRIYQRKMVELKGRIERGDI